MVVDIPILIIVNTPRIKTFQGLSSRQAFFYDEDL
jgi:hypothetical protein